ncbi:ribosome silencing factor [Actinobacteria bacterium IMCC26103]|jgi:ribosome-associated protein|nr:ribosome silencing factor [Actinobacteria bacterium IMCC26103]
MPASKSVTELTQVAARAIADKFGTEMIAIDLSDQMVLSEVFLIATGANIRQVDAIADEVEEKLRLIGEKPARREGTDEWILLDYSDLVVHIQSADLRRYYMLDRLWNDCPTIELDVVKENVANGR